MKNITPKPEEKTIFESPIKERDLNRIALISRKKGAHVDRKRENAKNACRKKNSTNQREPD